MIIHHLTTSYHSSPKYQTSEDMASNPLPFQWLTLSPSPSNPSSPPTKNNNPQTNTWPSPEHSVSQWCTPIQSSVAIQSVSFFLFELFFILFSMGQIQWTRDATLAAPSCCQRLQNNFQASLTARPTNRMPQAWRTFSVGCSSAYSVMAAALRTWSWESARRQSRATKTRSGIFCKAQQDISSS